MQRSILIVDSDASTSQLMIRQMGKGSLPIIQALTGKEAQMILADPNRSLAGVFISSGIQSHHCYSVVRSSFFHRPATPIYLVEESLYPLKLDRDQKRKLGVRDIVKKSDLSYSQMVQLIAPIVTTFDLNLIPHFQKEVDLNLDRDFIPIRATDFLSGQNSLFDVYVKIRQGKYLKILSFGDAFDGPRVESYLKKGVGYLYLRKDVQETYLKYCDHLASGLLLVESAPIEFKQSQILNAGEETNKFLKAQGLSEETLQYAKKFVTNTKVLIQQMKLEQNQLFKGFFSDLSSIEHGTGTALLAGILANTIEIQMEKTVQIIGLAAFFHDFSLHLLPLNCQNEDLNKMSEEEKKLYFQHPLKSVELLKGTKGFEPGTLQAIEQHHMRAKGGGFPERNSLYPLSKASEIIGICDEFNQMIIKQEKSGQKYDLLKICEKEILPHFSKQITYAFRSAFFPNKKFN